MGRPFLVTDCPRCGASRITFDVIARNRIGVGYVDWMSRFEVPAICRECRKITVWVLEVSVYDWHSIVESDDLWLKDINLAKGMLVEDYVSLKDTSGVAAPAFTPPAIEKVFNEAAMCRAVNCDNASAAMSRLCLDMITKSLLPEEGASGDVPTSVQRKRLFDRLDWLFTNQKLAPELKDLADSIRAHGNDGAHDGNCAAVDADDLLDFTAAVLERVYTLPERVRLARQRAIDRRGGA